MQTNTFQAVVITSGVESYALFTYQCGSMEWSGGATIGFNTNDTYMYFATHRLSGTFAVNEIACLNSPTTVWSNVLYQIGVTGTCIEVLESHAWVKPACLHKYISAVWLFITLSGLFI